MQQYYYVHRGEQQFGPYLAEALLDYVVQGNIVLSDLVYLEDSQTWISLEQAPVVQGFFGVTTRSASANVVAPVIDTQITEIPASETITEIFASEVITETQSSETTTQTSQISNQISNLPEVPKRPVEISPELNLEIIESETTEATAKTSSAVESAAAIEIASAESNESEEAPETKETVAETFSEEPAVKPQTVSVATPALSSESDYELTFTEGVASIEISPSTSGQLKVEVKAEATEDSETVQIEVQAARAARLTLTGEETCTVGGQASITVTALDEFGNLDSQCDAEVSIKYSGSAMGVSRIQLKNGIGTLTVTNERATVSSFVVAGTGAWSDLAPTDGAIEFTAGAATRFEIVAPQVINAGTVSRIQILAKDRFGNQTSQVESDVKLAIQHFVS